MKIAAVIKNIVRKLVYQEKATSDSYIAYLRKQGVQIGERTTIFTPTKTLIDLTRPWLIEVGNDVQIAEGVKILTHGFDWSVLKGVYGDVLGSAGAVCIGNNVFIGVNSVILKGVHIGDNVIIGAGSLVNKDIPDNVVAAGNPCKVIMTLDKYHENRKQAQIKEAKELVYKYRERYGKEPDEKALHEFFWLFAADPEHLPPCWQNMMEIGGNLDLSMKRLADEKKEFSDMQDFLEKI